MSRGLLPWTLSPLSRCGFYCNLIISSSVSLTVRSIFLVFVLVSPYSSRTTKVFCLVKSILWLWKNMKRSKISTLLNINPLQRTTTLSRPDLVYRENFCKRKGLYIISFCGRIKDYPFSREDRYVSLFHSFIRLPGSLLNN